MHQMSRKSRCKSRKPSWPFGKILLRLLRIISAKGDLMKSHQWTQEIWKELERSRRKSRGRTSHLLNWLLDTAWLCMPCRRCQHCRPTCSNKVSFAFFVLLLTPWYILHHFTSLFLVHMIHIWLQFIQHTKLVWNLLNLLKHPPCLHYIRLDSTDSSCPPMHYQELMTDVWCADAIRTLDRLKQTWKHVTYDL